jgi:NO-binding membrane sensor protein with MHYT domain/CheY-like chemotaxis protein/nitrogen-specific signal transduction histidine kinase
MAQHYHHGLVALSILVAILASYTALTLALRIRSAAAGWPAHAWLTGGGFAMGIGIWAMHFVGMLALSLPIAIAYDIGTTALSMLIAIAVSTFALRIASREQLTRPRLIAAAIAMGIGICSMHYVGMAAIEIRPAIRYDPYWVSASFAIAIAASFAALWVAFSTREESRWSTYRLVLGGVVMGFAIAGMHYAGMAAAQFPSGAASAASSLMDRDTGWLAGSVSTISVFILIATLLIALMDARATARRMRMQASLAAAREDSRAKDEFLALLGHELRNPLASMANAIFLLEHAQPRSEEWRFAHEVIKRQAAHVGRMVDDLLDVGRAVSGKMALDVQPFDLEEVVRRALDTLATAGKTRGRRIDYRGTSVWVRADRARLEQVVSNLVANAAEHSPEAGLIEVRLERRDAEAQLQVRDYGAGLDRETAPRVFDVFFQANHGVYRAKGGLGLGLTLVKRIVELHAGGVDVASEGLGRGTTFTVVLPAIAAPSTNVGREPQARAVAKRSVLVVEDADDARQTLRSILELDGHEVHTAADGASGLAVLLELRPDIALIDIGLPALNGYELASRARAAGVRSRLVALTGYGRPEDKAEASRAGFDLHLTKPASAERVLSLVSETP